MRYPVISLNYQKKKGDRDHCQLDDDELEEKIKELRKLERSLEDKTYNMKIKAKQLKSRVESLELLRDQLV